MLTRGIIAVAAKQNGARPAQAGEGTSSAVRANFEEIFKRPLGVSVVKKHVVNKIRKLVYGKNGLLLLIVKVLVFVSKL